MPTTCRCWTRGRWATTCWIPVLAEIAQAEAVQHARFWVAHFAEQVDDIRDRTLARLTAQGILEAEDGGVLRVPAQRVAHPSLPGGRGEARGRATANHAGAVQQRHSRSQRRSDRRPGGCLRRVRAPAAPRRAQGGARAHCPARPHGPARPRRDRGHPATAARDVAVPSPPRRPVPKAQPPRHQRPAWHRLHPQGIPEARAHLRDREERPDAGARDLLHHQAIGPAGHAVRP